MADLFQRLVCKMLSSIWKFDCQLSILYSKYKFIGPFQLTEFSSYVLELIAYLPTFSAYLLFSFRVHTTLIQQGIFCLLGQHNCDVREHPLFCWQARRGLLYSC